MACSFARTVFPRTASAANGSLVPDDERAHGLDERIPVKSFHDDIDIWEDMLRELAG